MKTLLTLIKEQEEMFEFKCLNGSDRAYRDNVMKEYRQSLITLLEANCERLRGKKIVPIFTSKDEEEFYGRRAYNKAIDEELALYGALIKEIQAN